MSYTKNALTAAERSRFVMNPEDRGTKTDFVQALRVLGARVLKPFFLHEDGGAGSHEVRVIFFSCRRRTWRMVFGEPTNVVDYHDAATNMPFQSWEHACRDGKATCVGHLFERFPGGPWVILARACFS